MEMMLVIAPPKLTCPKELSKQVITDSEAVSVPSNHYYRRLVGEGSLLLVPVTKAPADAAPIPSPIAPSGPKASRGGNR